MQQPDKQPTPKHEKPYDLSTFRVMIIEDSNFIANLLSSSLGEMGVGMTMTATNVASAREKILSFNAVPSSQNIDVIIIDWLMPDGSGSDLLKWIRGHKSDSIKFLPTIVCSAYASTELVENSRDEGANEVMVKPVSAEKLSRRILYVIDRPRPYVQTPDFFGPDRRRKVEKITGEDRRKTKEEDIEEEHEQFE